MKIDIRPFRAADAREILPDMPEDWMRFVDIYERFGFAYSAVAMMESSSRVIGSAGLCERRPGVGEAWTLFAEEIRGEAFFLHRAVKRMLPEATAKLGLWRVESYVDPRWPEHIDWIERLGFEFEGYMQNFFGAGAPGLLFVRVN